MPDNEVMIHELDTGTIDASSSFAFDVEESGEQVTRKASGSALGAFVNNSLEYTSALDTTSKSITGAINELHAINGYSYDAYDNTSTYAVGDLCIYNNALYKCTTAITTAEAWNASHWTATSIADEISALNTGKQDNSLSAVTWEHNNKLVNYGVNFIKSGKFLLIMGVFRGTTITAGETVFTIKNENISSLSDGNNFLQIVGNFSSNYLGYLKATNLNDDIEIKTDVNLDNPSLIFINGILPLN